MLIQVVVHTHAKRPHVETKANVLHIYVATQPIEGKANEAVIQALSKHFKVAPSRVVLKRGQKSKIKFFEVLA